MRTLIVGCGYVGIALGAELVRRGHKVWGLRRTLAADEQLKSAGIVPLIGDVTRPDTLEGLAESPEWIVFCASASGRGTEGYRRVYLEGARNLLDWLRSQTTVHKLVYTSSTGVYGQDDGSLVHEASMTEPATDTGQVLVQAEQLFLEAARQKNIPALVLRLAGIYGPGRGYWLRQYLSGEAKVEADGQRFLNMIHRDDVVGAVIAALERGRKGEVYNVVDDAPVRQRELFEWLAATLGRGMPPVGAAEPGRKRGATNKAVSNRKLREQLGYTLRYPSFREGFQSVIEHL